MRPENSYADPDLLRRVLSRLVGREREVRAVLAALAAGRNVLLVGPPGTSKSTILRTVAEEAGVPFFLVEGSADLTPQKLVGTFNPARVMADGFKPEYFEPGPLVRAMEAGGLLYIEEFNRMPEEASNVLIRAAEEGELAVPRLGVVRAKPGFRIACAMNPYDDVGTSRLSRALLDRFVMLRLDYQSRAEEVEIVRLRTGSGRGWLVELAVDVVRATRRHPAVRMGASVRGAIDMVLIAERLIEQRGAVDPEDLKMAAVMAVAPKLWMKDPARSPEEVVEEVLAGLLEGRGLDPFEGREEGGGGREEARRLIEEAREAPRRAALAIAGDPSLLDKLSHEGLAGLDAIARVYSLLPLDLREKARRIAEGLVVRAALGYAGRRALARAGGEPVDVDVDRTVERAAELGRSPEALSFFTARRRGRAYALVIDRSASMAGFKLVMGALAGASLAYAGDRVDDYCVLAFNTSVERLKGLRERRDVEEVVRSVLSLEARGYTDIYTALLEARRELVSHGYEPRAILVTDAEWTAGPNPLQAAPLFRQLHVVLVPSKYLGFARALAELGGGRVVLVRSIAEAPERLGELLRE